MNKRRLLTLAKYLEKVPPERFRMNLWATGRFCRRTGDERKHECGTTACAFGWASTIPSFRKAGLRLKRQAGLRLKRHRFEDPLDLPIMMPEFNKRTEMDAAAAFFGIEFQSALYLFAASWEGTYREERPSQVAKRIRDFVKSEGKVPS